MQPGRRVRLDTGPGPFGVPWVDRLRVDVDHRLPELVAAVPTAQWPRRQLITELARTARWSELVEHARAYHRHHPADRAAIADVVLSLRKGGQLETALALESELGLGPRPRGVTS